MKPLKTLTFLLVLSALSTTQAKPRKPYKLPAAFNQARYVFVEAEDGQEFDPQLDSLDRQAIADIDRALDQWKRYVLTIRRSDADLILVVRKGRLVTAKAAVQVGSGQQYPGGPRTVPANGVALGGAVGPPDDLLEVYLSDPNQPRGALIWQHTLADGLNAPQLALFQQLKEEVEKSYPTQTATRTSKP